MGIDITMMRVSVLLVVVVCFCFGLPTKDEAALVQTKEWDFASLQKWMNDALFSPETEYKHEEEISGDSKLTRGEGGAEEKKEAKPQEKKEEVTEKKEVKLEGKKEEPKKEVETKKE